MENDITLKYILSNDENIIKKEFEYSLDFIKCKKEKCYHKNYSTEKFEICKEECMNKLNKFNLLRQFIYQDYTKYYYNKFLDCVYTDEDKYSKCINETKILMKKNIEDIKKLILDYYI